MLGHERTETNRLNPGKRNLSFLKQKPRGDILVAFGVRGESPGPCPASVIVFRFTI